MVATVTTVHQATAGQEGYWAQGYKERQSMAVLALDVMFDGHIREFEGWAKQQCQLCCGGKLALSSPLLAQVP